MTSTEHKYNNITISVLVVFFLFLGRDACCEVWVEGGTIHWFVRHQYSYNVVVVRHEYGFTHLNNYHSNVWQIN